MGDITGFPLFRLNSKQIWFWIAGKNLKRELASMICKTWRSGAVVLSPTLYAIATVDPRGNINDLPPPYQQFEMWQVCNKPSVRYDECACREYYDPEVLGPWKLREKERGLDIHHPHCQFDRTASRVWVKNLRDASARVGAHQNPQARPDEWVKTRQEVLDT